MSEAEQHLFSSRQLLAALIKEANVHEGKWVLTANFAFTPGNYGPSLDKMSPGVIVTTTHFGILRAPEDAPDGVWIDAAEINPTPRKAIKKTKT